MPGYYIFRWTGNAYTLQGKYICHSLYSPVITPEGELFCPAKFLTPTRKTFYWHHETYEAIPVMVNSKQVVMPYIEFIQEKNTTNNYPSRFKGYADMNPPLLCEHDHEITLDKNEARENHNHDEYVEDESFYNVHSDYYDDNDN